MFTTNVYTQGGARLEFPAQYCALSSLEHLVVTLLLSYLNPIKLLSTYKTSQIADILEKKNLTYREYNLTRKACGV